MSDPVFTLEEALYNSSTHEELTLAHECLLSPSTTRAFAFVFFIHCLFIILTKYALCLVRVVYV